MLEYRNITKKFGNKEAVKELTLKLKKGTIYGLLGENGSGKTTLMKMAAGLTQPTEGEILFEGHPLSYQDKASIAYMSTEPFFYSYMKVKDVEEYYADFFEDFDREQFRKTIERLGLNEEMKASAMSSGMNAKLKAAFGNLCVGGYDYLVSIHFTTVDGIHYTPDVSKKLYNYVIQAVKRVSAANAAASK